MMFNKIFKGWFLNLFFVFVFSGLLYSQSSDFTKSTLFDNGKMWTFDYPPTKYFEKTYNFSPDKQWFEKARLSALRVRGCSGAFISEDGLVITNHHCARGVIDQLNKSGENLNETGFFAATLGEERKIPNYYADQLMLIEDVTEEVKKAFESGKTDEEKIKNRTAKISDIEKRYNDKTGLTCNVITFYNGGKYSLYGYKRYNDIRLVFAVENQIENLGGNYDNFTYPRYDQDFTIYRVYDEDGKPFKTKNFFKWNPEGAKEGEMVFVIGNPGSTSRLFTVSQLEFNRDYVYPFNISNMEYQINLLNTYIEKHPDEKIKYYSQSLGILNSFKATTGYLAGLKNQLLMERKKDFENTFKSKVFAKPELKIKYALVWDEIESLQKERAKYYNTMNAFNPAFGGPYFSLANSLVTLATEMQKPEDQRSREYKSSAINNLLDRLKAVKSNEELDLPKVLFQLNLLKNIEISYSDVKNFFNGKNPEQLAKEMIKSTILNQENKVNDIINQPEIVNKSDDPFLTFAMKFSKKYLETKSKYDEVMAKTEAKVQLLGNALYDVYGTEMPPDATFTLRVADGIIKGYDYNGTIAPPNTTFYGMYDRLYSFRKPDWDLPPRWKNPPSNLNLSTPATFISTADIIGGNSGSPVINKNHEYVGLIFDGNMESLEGQYIFLDKSNRSIAVHVAGMLEGLEKIYKADRVAKEIRAGKIVK